VIITLILIGKWLEIRAKRRSGDAIRALADLGVKPARLEDGTDVPVDVLRPGMRFVVRPGEKIATDGRSSRDTPRSTRRWSPANRCRWRSNRATR
jgi:Cu+-exporting ATPase